MKIQILFLCLFTIIACNETPSNQQEISNPTPPNRTKTTTPQNGDIIFQTSRSSQSLAIQKATKSRYSHMGIIYEKDGKFQVYEAVQPVKFTPLLEWIKRGEDSHYVIKRLKNHDAILTEKKLDKMKQIGKRYKGKNYDLLFAWSDEKIYCSELVWKIYKEGAGIEIGSLERWKSFDLSDKIVQQKIRERYGDDLPLEEWVISPESMFNSSLLETVMEN